jgi:hypothetical protein
MATTLNQTLEVILENQSNIMGYLMRQTTDNIEREIFDDQLRITDEELNLLRNTENYILFLDNHP